MIPALGDQAFDNSRVNPHELLGAATHFPHEDVRNLFEDFAHDLAAIQNLPVGTHPLAGLENVTTPLSAKLAGGGFNKILDLLNPAKEDASDSH